MPQQIPVRDFENPQRFNVVLGGRRYSLVLSFNPVCEKWFVEVIADGQTLIGPECLTCGQFALRGLPCMPATFGGLYLEPVNDDVTGRRALPCGSKRLWFYSSAELFLRYGTVFP